MLVLQRLHTETISWTRIWTTWWHDILATIDVSANVHATTHCNDKGYDLVSINMVSFELMEEVDEIILEVKRAPGFAHYFNSYDKEIIFEGSKVNTSRISQRCMRPDVVLVLCISLCMEISLDGGDSKAHINEKPILEEWANQPLEEINKVFYDAREDNEQKIQRELELSKIVGSGPGMTA